MFGWLAGWLKSKYRTVMPHQCDNMFQPWMFRALFSDTATCFFFFNDHVLTLWKRHELRTYLCSVLNVFGGAKVFQKMLNDEPASWTQFLVGKPIINIDKPTRTIFGRILRYFLVILGIVYYWVACIISILQKPCKFPQTLWMLSRLRPSGRNCAQEVM